ncbi:MAG TPA: hypothetical protein VMR33_16245, partial [Candidatus Baltobacteraceae bacterium]|nr:hypothetical protein [Candidatus Baltobacteraceae bacterium]
MKLAAVYSFNHGTEVVSEKYPELVVEINAAIKSIDVSRHKTKKSKEKTMPGQMLTGGPHPLDHGAHKISATFADCCHFYFCLTVIHSALFNPLEKRERAVP